MIKRELNIGDVVQLKPNGQSFSGCFLVVTEPKEFGCQGYIQGVGATFDETGHHYYLRPSWDEMEYIGAAAWVAE